MFGKVGEVVGGGVGVGVGGVGGGGVGGSSLQQVADTKRRPTCRSLKYYCEIFLVPITLVQIFCYCFLSCKAKNVYVVEMKLFCRYIGGLSAGHVSYSLGRLKYIAIYI